jgi:hypothetical protein
MPAMCGRGFSPCWQRPLRGRCVDIAEDSHGRNKLPDHYATEINSSSQTKRFERSHDHGHNDRSSVISSGTEIPALIAEGFIKNLKQSNRDATPKAATSAAAAAAFLGCLPADAYWRVTIAAGQRYIVTASIATRCDSRGWSCDNFTTRSGPDGVPGFYVSGSLGYPGSPIGAP